MKRLNTRAVAAQILTCVFKERKTLTEAVSTFKNASKDPKDNAFIQALVFGVLRDYPRLQFIADQLLQSPLKAKEQILLYLIYIGLYQLYGMRVSDHAAISETVEAAKQLGKSWGANLINAILRSYQRQKSSLENRLLLNDEAKYAHPLWLIEKIKTAWPEHWTEILEANNQIPPLSIRVNKQKLSRTRYLSLLQENNIPAHEIPCTDNGLILELAQDIKLLPGFKEGFFSVQDGAAQFCASLLELQPKLRILDACAAPGGKTTHILETESSLSEVVALDISESRTKRIQENLERLNLHATVKTADASQTHWWDGQLFDRILLDAPCSASGVIRRHPDIKYLRKPNDIANMAHYQLRLLKTLWPLLKQNGLLVYVTCSILPEENENMIEQFLKEEPKAKLEKTILPCGIALQYGHQILPGQNEMDGFYYARISKKS